MRMTTRSLSLTVITPAGGAISTVTRAPAPAASTRVVTRGTRAMPSTSRREPRRYSTRCSATGPSARGTKSTGASQRLPARVSGPGSATTRPSTDTSARSRGATMLRPRTVMTRPPCRSSRTASGRNAATSSSATYSWPLTSVTGRARRPAAETTVIGAGLCATASEVSSRAIRTAVAAAARKSPIIRPPCAVICAFASACS